MLTDHAGIDAIFCEAIEIASPAERDAYLQQACGSDPERRRQVDRLLRAHYGAGSFLEERSPAFAATVAAPPAITESPGTIIGPYKLLEQIGEGGFGVVFLAEQTAPVKRKVALKVIKPGMDTRQVIARFEAERQALALMDHPNIAKVFDAGTTGGGVRSQESGVTGRETGSSLAPVACLLTPSVGRPYFVMELVRGVPITDYCDQHQLTPGQRLDLFVTVCQAVQHAHQKGIIHRDIKPSNVLVTLHDDQPVVKVIDFGVAKAMTGQLTDKTLFTGFAQLVGTPLYMSPEQAALNGIDVDTRSDIYSLGVLLYELLTGTTPFDKSRLHQVDYDEIRRIIREEEPPRPSTRLSTLGAIASTVARQRHTDPSELMLSLRGDLDWIVMKCLEKERNRRYETPALLAADVRRFLTDEPVQACPPTVPYRLRKLARRHRRVLISASAMALAAVLAVAALSVSTVLVWRANQELTNSLARERQEANFHRITLAHQHLSADNLGRALELLQACPEDLRDWEWHYLMRLCRVEPLVLRDNTEVNAVAFSPNGEWIAAAGGDGTIRIWNSLTGQVERTLRAHANSAASVAFHPDGMHLASAGADRHVRVWSLTTGQEVFDGECDAIRTFGAAYTVAFSPLDNRQLAASSDGSVRIWNWISGQLLQTFPGHESHSIPVAFSNDGRRLATNGGSREGLKLWDPESGGPPLRTLPGHRHPVSALVFSLDDGLLASASFDRSVKLWDTTTGALLQSFSHPGNVNCVAFSPSGRRLASSGEDRTVRVWDTTSGREVLALRGHAGMCGCVAFSADGHRLASASNDGTIRIWDATPLQGNEGQEIMTFVRHRDEIRSVAFSPDGRQIASAGADQTVKVWDASTGNMEVELKGHDQIVFCVAWQPDGRRIASAGSDGPRRTVQVWDAQCGRELFALPHGREYYTAAFSPDGRMLVTGQGDGVVQVWDAQLGREVATLGRHKKEVRGVVFSRDGLCLASASGDGRVKLWDATRLDQMQQARLTLQARVPGASLNVGFSSDGQRLATGGEENTVKIWDVQTGRELHTLRGHSGEVYTLAFSPDAESRWVASAGEDSSIKIWESHAGKLVRSFRGHTGLVSSLAFSPDGRRLVSGSRDKTVKVWDVTQLQRSEREP